MAKGTESAGGAARGAVLQDGFKMALLVVGGLGSKKLALIIRRRQKRLLIIIVKPLAQPSSARAHFDL